MDAKIEAAQNEVTNFEPSSDLIQEEECDTLLVYLPGFTKEQLKVQLAGSKILKIGGLRKIGDTKWSSFQKDFPVSANIDTNKITAKFEGGILYVRQAKLIVPAKKEEQKVTPSETPQPRTPPAKEQPAPPKIDQEQANTKKATPTDDENKKSSAKEEGKSTKEKEKSENEKKDEKNNVQEKNDKKDDQNDAARSKCKNDDKLANKAKLDASKLIAESPAAKLKMARQQMTMVLTVLFAFALAIYIRNLGWFSRKAEN